MALIAVAATAVAQTYGQGMATDGHRGPTMTNTQCKRVDAYLSVAQIADLLKISERTVRRWIWAGRLPAIRTSPGPSGHVRIPQESLERFLAGAGAILCEQAQEGFDES